MNINDILNNLETYISNHQKVIKVVGKFRKIAENEVGQLYKKKIIRSLRLNDELSNYIDTDGTLFSKQNDKYVPLEGLTIDDVIVEETLPRAALDTLITYSVGDKPFIDFDDKDWLEDFEDREDIHSKVIELADEMLITGDAFYKTENINGEAQITVMYKEEVIIVPDTFNTTRVGAYIYFTVLSGQVENGVQKPDYNYVEIYFPDGKVYIYSNQDDKNQYKRVSEKKNEDVNVGLGEFTFHHVKGLKRVKGSLYNHSIFKGLDTSFVELVIRKTSNAFLFNKVNNPALIMGGNSYSSINTETGEREVKTSGKAIEFNDPTEAAATRYLEPPTGHTTSIYSHIDYILDDAYKQLGVNEISLGISQQGNVVSGEAFKKAIIPTLNKCRDIVTRLRTPLTKLYKQAYKIEKKKDASLTIKFKDGISLSEKENIENKANLVNTKLLSRVSILIEMGYTETEAWAELRRIAEEQKIIMEVFEEGEVNIPGDLSA